MKNTLIISLFLLVCTNSIFSQSTDRFIRIVGNSSYQFNADTYRVYFNISEILPNNYSKDEYKSLESNITETIEFLKKSGVNENQISKNFKNKNSGNHGNIKTEFYYMDISDKAILSKVLSTKNTSFKIENTKFLYQNISPNIELDLSKAAIVDAERKAKSIAKEIGKKVGKILNIEDKSGNCCSDFGETDQENITKKYTINITFELLD